MKSYRASTTINASRDVVWKILTDASGYPNWDMTMDHIEGKLSLGETVKFYTKLSPNAFPVKVTTFEHGTKVVLTGGMPLGLFKSERMHTLTTADTGKTLFTTEEVFSGLLVPLFAKNIPDLTENFRGFVEALKKQAEK